MIETHANTAQKLNLRNTIETKPCLIFDSHKGQLKKVAYSYENCFQGSKLKGTVISGVFFVRSQLEPNNWASWC